MDSRWRFQAPNSCSHDEIQQSPSSSVWRYHRSVETTKSQLQALKYQSPRGGGVRGRCIPHSPVSHKASAQIHHFQPQAINEAQDIVILAGPERLQKKRDTLTHERFFSARQRRDGWRIGAFFLLEIHSERYAHTS